MERLEEPKSSALWWNWRRMSSKGKCSAVCEGCDGADGGGDGDDRGDDADATETTKKGDGDDRGSDGGESVPRRFD